MRAWVITLILLFCSPVFADDLDDFRRQQRQGQQEFLEAQQRLQLMQNRLIQLDALIQYLEGKKDEANAVDINELIPGATE